MSINTDENLLQGILKHGPNILEHCLVDTDNPNIENYIRRISDEKLSYPFPLIEEPQGRKWFIPKEYKEMDIEEFLINQCPKENYDRLVEELNLYKKHNMLDVLKVMKYLVDTLRKNNIVWGVGRGSSVSSYCLYLIGIHKIDSVKYRLPISDFFKGE
jgi:DNA polymerase III alpha subunit